MRAVTDRARATRRHANTMLEARTALLRNHDLDDWHIYRHLPPELWPEAAIASYARDFGFEDPYFGGEPSAAELRALVREAAGAEIITIPQEQDIT